MEQHVTIIPMSDSSERITQQDVSPTVLPDAFLTSDVACAAKHFHMPRYDELPNVELYRDQVIEYIEQVLGPLSGCSDGPWLTPSMVNNYVKQRLVPAPVKKLYGREQIARLLTICIFKQFLPIDAITRLFRIQKVTYPIDVAFDYVSAEIDNAVDSAFSRHDGMRRDTASLVTRESLLVRSAAAAFASKVFLMSYLTFAGYEG